MDPLSASVIDFSAVGISPKGVISLAQKWFSTDVTREARKTFIEDGESEHTARYTAMSYWSDRDEVQFESAPIRAAFGCFDIIYNFLAAAPLFEKAFFSIHLRVQQPNGSITITNGQTLAIKKIDLGDTAFENVGCFIDHVAKLALIRENDHKNAKCTVVLDANICATPGSPRTSSDNNALIQMTKLAIRALFEVARVDSNVEHVHIQPGETITLPKYTNSLAFLTADFEDKGGVSRCLVRQVRSVAHDTTTDIHALLKSVHEIRIDNKKWKNLILLGNTGAGKSYSGNWILDELGDTGRERFFESDSDSMTSYVDFLPRGQEGEWRVWDTPGLNDSYDRDDKFIYDIETSLFDAHHIHAIVLCLASLERIDDALKKSLRAYSRIFGKSISRRLLVFVNRQPRRVSTLQIKNLINEMSVNCGITLETWRVFDMNGNGDDISQNRRDAISLVTDYGTQDGIEMNKVCDVVEGLRKIKELEDDDARSTAEEELLRKSAMALRKVLQTSKDNPLKVQPSLGTSIIITSGREYEMRDGYQRCVEYHLLMPQHIRKRFDRRLALFGKCLRLWNSDVKRVIDTVTSMRLVYRMLPDERQEGKRHGVLREVYKIRLQLWGIDDALLDDAKYQIERMVGTPSHRDVTFFGGASPSFEAKEDSEE